MERNCPNCGAPLHEQAVFCPHCASPLNQREAVRVPVPMRRRVLRVLIPLAAVCAGLLLWYVLTLPEVFDSKDLASITYTDEDGSYLVLVGYSGDAYFAATTLDQVGERDGEYRFPQCVFVTYYGSIENAAREFGPKVERIEAAFVNVDDPDYAPTCTAPAYNDYAPGAVATSFIDFVGRENTAELVWTIHMKNGDQIRLHQQLTISETQTHDYYPDDVSMNTVEEIQVLVDRLIADSSIADSDTINLHLPPVTYEGSLLMAGRPINLIGTVDEEQNRRTTFADTLRFRSSGSNLFYVENIDFIGSGMGTGLHADARVHIINCTFAGWETGVLCYQDSWVNLQHCQLLDNGVGFHFNSKDGWPTHTIYEDNEFRNNGIGVLLEKVPNDVSLKFPGSVFSGNDVDIDNRCNHALEIGEAIFET